MAHLLLVSLLLYVCQPCVSTPTFAWPPLVSPLDGERANLLQDPYMSPAFELYFDISSYNLSEHALPSHEISLSAADANPYTFHCFLEGASPHGNASIHFPRLSEQEKRSHVLKLLHPLLNQPCLILQDSWWTYEYCHLSRVRQFRPGLILSSENSLGTYFSEADSVIQFLSGQSVVQAQNASEKIDGFAIEYQLGDACEEFNTRRAVTVEFRCNHNEPRSRIVKVQEAAPCKYWMLIESPLLCKDPWFSQGLGRPKFMRCRLKDIYYVEGDHPRSLSAEQLAHLERLVQNLNHPGRSLRTLILKSKGSLADTPALQRSTSRTAPHHLDPYEGLLSLLGLGAPDPASQAKGEPAQEPSAQKDAGAPREEKYNFKVVVLDSEDDQTAIQSLLDDEREQQASASTVDKAPPKQSVTNKKEKSAKRAETPFRLVQEIIKLMIPDDSVEPDDPKSGEDLEQEAKTSKDRRKESSKKSTRRLRKQILETLGL